MSNATKSTRSIFDKYKSMFNHEINTIPEKSVKTQSGKLVGKENDYVLHNLSEYDWSFSDANTTYLSHDIHPYPAKFPPQLPARFIELLSFEGDTVWDPFGGCGTTALEALINNRNCISTDINPIGSIIGRAKTTTLNQQDENELTKFIDQVEYYSKNIEILGKHIEGNINEIKKEIPSIPNIEKWFEPAAICELAFIKYLLKKNNFGKATNDIAFASLSKIITSVSNQEGETTYRATPKKVEVGETLDLYRKDIRSNFLKIKSLSDILGYKQATFITTNVMKEIVGDDKILKASEVDLIVTSPPYPNAFDYHLYHRFRIFWLNGNPVEMGKSEIGSHLKYQRNKNKFDQYEKEMRPVLANCFKSLKPGRYAVFILGNAIFDGIEYKTADRIKLLAQDIGFECVGIIDRPLPANKRSMKSWARRANSEQILIIKKPIKNFKVKLVPANYRLWDYEKRISKLERLALCESTSDSFTSNNDQNIKNYKKLTFYKSFFLDNSSFNTWQNVVENSELNSCRKDPKYLTHGIHAYKGKFYPQLVRPLLNILKVPVGGKVFDPFCGSGTVLLEAILNGYDAYGCDINPTAIDIATAKNTIFKVDPYQFQKIVAIFLSEISTYKDGDYTDYLDPDALDEINRWFAPKVIKKIGFILLKISLVPDDRIKLFLKVILSSIIREVSQQDPGDLRIRRRKNEIDDAPVFEIYKSHLEKQVKNIISFHKIKHMAPEKIGEAKIWRGNSRNLEQIKQQCNLSGPFFDIVITSPPYATALPYIDTNRLNMLITDGLNAKRRAPIESEMTGTREIPKSSRINVESKIFNNDFESIQSRTAKETIKKIFFQNHNTNVGFRRQNMAALLYMYFRDMTDVMTVLNKIVKPSGHICIIIGDTTTTTFEQKVIIKTTQVLRETGEFFGWKLIHDIPISVTTENNVHIKNAITENNILVFKII